MSPLENQLNRLEGLNALTVPDIWQQEAVSALRQGRDVVLHAPTGAGKTLVFELWSNHGKNRGQAIYTVPTRALANDKLAEWRSKGWDIGIATGDLSENLDAPIIVATLETQKFRLIQGIGPTLLVVDEYQMIGDQDRGLNYELAIAMTPPTTQLLMMSGSVENAHHVVRWLNSLGRDAVLISHHHRPVPLEEFEPRDLSFQLPSSIKGLWPKMIAKVLAEDLGPILVFTPQRQAAEKMADALSRNLPNPHPLQLNARQQKLAGDRLSRILKSRIAFHHSGLSYEVRAGLIEPLSKAGQLRVVVATMGLAAGINFSLRSVIVAGESYRRQYLEHPVQPDELLQMFGRAGRRGLDEIGYLIIGPNGLRMQNSYPKYLTRTASVDWGALLSVMAAAADRNESPYAAAVKVQKRLFTTKPIFLGIEHSVENPASPCGLHTDTERARYSRSRLQQILNSRGEWQPIPKLVPRPLREIRIPPDKPSDPTSPENTIPETLPMLSHRDALENIGHGDLVPVAENGSSTQYGREFIVAELKDPDRVLLIRWVKRLIHWKRKQLSRKTWEEQAVPKLKQAFEDRGTPWMTWIIRDDRILARIGLGGVKQPAVVDAYDVPLWKPLRRKVLQEACVQCNLRNHCLELSKSTGVALLWIRMKLTEANGTPTLRGRIVSFFAHGYGLAIAAALESTDYSLNDLVYDIAGLAAGYRFSEDEYRWGGRLADTCRETYGTLRIEGYLENGVPPDYGAGTEEIVKNVKFRVDTRSRRQWVTDQLGPGDIDRMIIEWRSLLRQIANAPSLDWPRWTDLQKSAAQLVKETKSPTLKDLPKLDFNQTKRVNHRLIFKRFHY